MFVIATPAEDLQLLTEEQLRVAAGLAADDDDQDGVLADLGLRVAAEIATLCNVRIGAACPPTLRRETIVQTFRGPRLRQLILARRHDVTISSVEVDGVALAADDYEADAESGLLFRLVGEYRSGWSGRKIVVTYDAGFDDVPADLAGVAADLLRIRHSEGDRDPLVKATEISVDGVMRERSEFWVGSVPGSSASAGVAADILARLRRYRNVGTFG